MTIVSKSKITSSIAQYFQMKILLIIFIFIHSFVSPEAIPKYIRDKLRSIVSFHDFTSNFELIYHPTHTNSHIQKSYSTISARRPVTINTASFFKSSSRLVSMEDSQGELDDHTFEHLSLFGSIKQGNDTCQLQSVCVPIPVENENPQAIIYPKCYEAMQCVGSCCDSFEKCHPHSIRKLQKPIVEMVYVGSGRFMLNKTINITMEEHTSCSCYECGLNISQCPSGFVLGPNCRCECANTADRDKCLGNNIWNEHNCSCSCEHITCSLNSVLDRKSCECTSKKERSELMDSLISSRSVDLSSLPKLKAKVIHRNHGI